MPRPSGFTDAELAAAAWKRNVELQATLREAERVKNASGHGSRKRKEERKSERKKRKKERERQKREAMSRDGSLRHGARRRSASLGSVDSLGRDRKRDRSASPGSFSAGEGHDQSQSKSLRRLAKAKAGGGGGEDWEESLRSGNGQALGWRGAFARASSRSPPSARGWSSASSLGSISSDRDSDDEGSEAADVKESGESRQYGKLAELGGMDEVPADPHRPEHDDRSRPWRRGRRSPTSTTGDGVRHRHRRLGSDSDESDRAGHNSRRRRDWGASRHGGAGRRDSMELHDDNRRRRLRGVRSRSPGDGSSARSLSRSISRDRRSRRSSRSRSRSPSNRRSRSRDRTEIDAKVTSLIREYSRKPTASPEEGSGKPSAAVSPSIPMADLVSKWTHDLFDDTANDSPQRSTLPPGYQPEPPTWVSRAGGVYLPVKRT